MTLVAELASALHDTHVLFNRVGEAEYTNIAEAGVRACSLLLEEGEAEVDDHGILISLRSAAIQTSQRLASARVAGVVLDAISPFWDVLPTLWASDKAELGKLWSVVMADVRAFAAAHDAVVEDEPADPPSEFVMVSPVPASEAFVQALQQLSGVEPALRLLFIEAEDPEVVWHATVLDESALDSVLRPFPYTLWRGTADLGEAGTVHEFRVYTANGHRIFRMTGHLAACNKSLLDALKLGEFLPRMAHMKTASVIRMTFSLRAMVDPQFRDFLRSLGGVPASPVSWDIPIYSEADVEQKLDQVKSGFGYTVSIYQVIDTPEQNIYASTNPEGHVARMLSAEIADVITDSDVDAPSMADFAQRVASVLTEVTGPERHVLEQVAAASRVHAHFVVARTGEIRPRAGRFACQIGKMFSKARTEAKATKVVVFAGSNIPKIVSVDVLEPK